MTYFRKRIGAAGFEKILSASVALHGESAIEEDMCIETTIQRQMNEAQQQKRGDKNKIYSLHEHQQ